MEKQNRGGKQDQLEDHSLPGTNQAGETLKSCEKNQQEDSPKRSGAREEQLEEHTLPGTNQAGKGPDSEETNDVK